MFPTRTAGSGRVRANSARSGRGQGRGSSKLMAKCQQCGMPNNIRAIVTSGGDLSGDGARGAITKTSTTGTLLNGQTFTETYGDAAARKGGGCACCHSRNSVRYRPGRLSI